MRAPQAGLVPYALQVENFGHLKARGHDAVAMFVHHGTHADAGREVAHAAVQFGDERDRAEVERRRVDEDGQGLPLLGREPRRVSHSRDLRGQRLLRVDLAVDDNDALGLLAREALNLCQVFVGERMGEVEDEHGLSFQIFSNCLNNLPTG